MIRQARSFHDKLELLEEEEEEIFKDGINSNELEEIKESKHENRMISKKMHSTDCIIPKLSELKIPIVVSNLMQKNTDLFPEVTTTQNFMEKINTIYTQKSNLNKVDFGFLFLIVIIFNIFLVLLNLGQQNELTSSLISIKIKFYFSLSLLIFGLYKVLPKKKHFLYILIIFLNFIIFFTNSVCFQFLFYSERSYNEAAHLILFERDLRLLLVTLFLIYYRFKIKNVVLRDNCIILAFFSIIFSIIYFHLGIWKVYEDYALSYFYLVLMFIFMLISLRKNYFLKGEKKNKRKTLELEALKIKEELESVKKKLESTFKTISRPETDSKGDELLMKLKYLKFQALVNLKKRITSPYLDKRKVKKGSNFIITDSGGSYTPSKLSGKNTAAAENEQSEKNQIKLILINLILILPNSYSFTKTRSI